jgi:Alpha/beta hydrolase domain
MAGGQSALLATPIHPLNGLGVSAVQGNEPGPARARRVSVKCGTWTDPVRPDPRRGPGRRAGPHGRPGIGILLGSTRVFDTAELARRYPAGPGEYAAAFREATRRAAAAGFVLEQDVDEMVAVAAAAYPAR